MQEPVHAMLLLPKVRPPRPGARTLQRPRLLRRVQDLAAARLTLVMAPSGFGKTTLGASWAGDLQRQGQRVAWLSLQDTDDSCNRFAEYLAFACEQAFAPAGRAAGPQGLPHGVEGEQLIAVVINRIARTSDDFFLFIDDLHLLGSEALAGVLTLLRHASGNLHLVLLSRPIAPDLLLRACQGAVQYVDATELRFSETETGAMFASHERAAAAHRLTAGWPAALGILAASASEGDDRVFAGRGSFLAETHLGVLLEAALSRLTPRETELLEVTCIAGRMSAALFVHLAGGAQVRETIQSLEQVHCLLSRVSDDDHWFACHDLVRQGVLARLPAARVRDILQRAGEWHAGRANWRQAVELALRADDRSAALACIERSAHLLFYGGDLLTVREWDRQLGLSADPSVSIKVLLTIALTRILATPDDAQTLHRLLDAIEARLHRDRYSNATHTVYWHLQAMRAVLACRGDRLDEALRLSLDCLRQPGIYASLTETVRCVAAYCYLQARRWKEFHEVLTEVSRAPVDQYTLLSTIYRQVLLGLENLIRLRATAARRELEEGLALATERLGPVSVPGALCATLLAVLQLEALAFEDAEKALASSLDLVAQSGHADVVARGYEAAARAALLRGDEARAISLLERWEALASAAACARSQAHCAYVKLCILLRTGVSERAAACLAHLRKVHAGIDPETEGELPEVDAWVGLAESRYSIACGRPAAACSILMKVLADAQRRDDLLVALHAGMALAQAHCDNGDHGSAVAQLEAALGMARAAGFGATVLCQQTDLARLLALYQRCAPAGAQRSEHLAYMEGLLAAGKALLAKNAISLSPREESVLKLLAQDKSNKEISGLLNITPETVKTHLKSIFAKLEVSKRNAAVRRAQMMQLL